MAGFTGVIECPDCRTRFEACLRAEVLPADAAFRVRCPMDGGWVPVDITALIFAQDCPKRAAEVVECPNLPETAIAPSGGPHGPRPEQASTIRKGFPDHSNESAISPSDDEVRLRPGDNPWSGKSDNPKLYMYAAVLLGTALMTVILLMRGGRLKWSLFTGLFLSVGLYSVLAAALDFEHFFEANEARPIVERMGRGGARIFYAFLGSFLVALGTFALFAKWYL